MSQKKKPASSIKAAEVEARKFRFAFALFAVYAVGYIAFTVAGTFMKGVLTARVAGVNLGVLSGMTIIASAILIAVVYNWYCGKVEAG